MLVRLAGAADAEGIRAIYNHEVATTTHTFDLRPRSLEEQRPEHHRQGMGRMLLDELVRLATGHGFHTVMARIVGGHEASIALHRACGFELVGVEREVGRKFGRWLDVAVMQRLLP